MNIVFLGLETYAWRSMLGANVRTSRVLFGQY